MNTPYTITDKLFKIGDFKISNTYCESGSCYGWSIQRALDGGYTRIKSCEVFEPYYKHCVERFKGKNVELFLGRSVDKFDQMLADVYEPITIFLDAHPAGEGTNSHEEYIKGNIEFTQHWILTKELEIITQHRKDHLICIDDQVFGPEADSYMGTLLKANPTYRFSYYDERLAPHDPVAKNKILVCEPFY